MSPLEFERLAARGQVEPLLATWSEHFEDLSDKQRENLMSAMASTASDRVVGPLVAATKNDRSEFVRAAAVRGLSKLGSNDRSAAALAGALQDSSRMVRSAAVKSLASTDRRELREDVAALLDDPEASVRCDAVQGLGDLKSRDFVPRIIPLLQDPVKYVRFKAVDVLVALGDKSALPALKAARSRHRFLSRRYIDLAVKSLSVGRP